MTSPLDRQSSVDHPNKQKIEPQPAIGDVSALRVGEAAALTREVATEDSEQLSREARRKKFFEDKVKEKQPEPPALEKASPAQEPEEEKAFSQAEQRKTSRDAEATQTREKASSRSEMRKSEKTSTRRLRVRVIPIWLRLLILIILCVAALIGGTMVGYGIIGKGNPMDVFNSDTWTHIRDIIYANK